MRTELLGRAIIVIALALLGAILFSLFLPIGGPSLSPILVGVTALVAVGLLAIGLLRGS